MNLMSVVRIADEMWMFDDLYWMDDKNENGDYKIDRVTACLLLKHTIETDRIVYTYSGLRVLPDKSIDGDRKKGDTSLYKSAYGYNTDTFTVVNDGKWFALDNTPGSDGKYQVAKVTASATSVTPIYGTPINLSADVAEKMGLSMESVGHTFEIDYKKPVNNEITNIFSFTPKSSEIVINGMGYYNDGNGSGQGKTFANDANKIVGGTANFDDARLYVNYYTATMGSLVTYVNNNQFGGANWLSQANGDHTTIKLVQEKFADSDVRVIYNGNKVQYVFLVWYQRAQVSNIYTANSGLNNGHQVVDVVTDGGYDYPHFAHSVRIANAKDWVDLGDMKKDDWFMSYMIGFFNGPGSQANREAQIDTKKIGVKPVTKVTGKVTQRNLNGTEIIVDGITYKGAEVGPNGTNYSNNGKTIQGAAAVNADVDLFLFKGKIINAKAVTDPNAGKTDGYAVVKNSVWEQTKDAFGVVTADTFKVDILFSDGSGGIYTVKATKDGSDYKIANEVVNSTATNPITLTTSGAINAILFEYVIVDEANKVVELKKPTPDGTAPTTSTASSSSLPVRNVFPSSDWGSLSNKYILSNTITFIKTTDNGGTWKLYTGNTLPRINAGGTAIGVQAIYQQLVTSGDNLALKAAALILNVNTNTGTPGVTPEANWAVILGSPVNVLHEGAPRWAQNIMTKDGTFDVLYTKDNTNHFSGLDDKDVIEYTKDGDGWIDAGLSAEDLSIGNNLELSDNADERIKGINTELYFLIKHDNSILDYTTHKDNIKFLLVDGANSKTLTITEVADAVSGSKRWLRYHSGSTWNYVIFK